MFDLKNPRINLNPLNLKFDFKSLRINLSVTIYNIYEIYLFKKYNLTFILFKLSLMNIQLTLQSNLLFIKERKNPGNWVSY